MFEQAVAFHQQGRVSDAKFLCLKILLKHPEHAHALHLLGMIEIQRNNTTAALELFERAIRANSEDAAFFNSRGNAHMHLGRFEDALASYDQALAINGQDAAVLMNRGNALQQLGRFEAALESYERALAIKPDDVAALINRGNALQQLKQFDRAIESYACALEIEPDHGFLLGEKLRHKMNICDWSGLAKDHEGLARDISAGKRVSNPFRALNTPLPPALQRKCSEIYVRELFPRNSLLPQFGDGYAHDRIRLGYFSADFRAHAVAHQIVELLERHDRSQFDVMAFSFYGPSEDAMRSRVERAVDRFIDVSALSDKDIASLARNLEIDIAIDLNGFTLGGRSGIFAMGAAPIQVNYLGYPGTLAADYVDYMIADPILIPEDQQPHYAEKICYLPDTYFAADTKRAIAPARLSKVQCGLPDEGFVFSCFNPSYKITPEIFDVWMRLLNRVAGSTLWLSQSNDAAMRNLQREAQARGMEPNRLVFAPFLARMEDHLARLALADLFLDTLPYNAHATASDALYVGLPVLTCLGKTFPGRVAASLLNAIGLPELITRSLDEYEALSLDLAATPGKLPALREKLRANRLTYPLFDAALFAGHIETAYGSIWRRHQAGLSPDHVHIRSQRGPTP